MDPGTGKIHAVTEDLDGTLRDDDGVPIPASWVPFRLGEVVTIKGAMFQIETIRGAGISLRAIGRKDRGKRKRRRRRA